MDTKIQKLKEKVTVKVKLQPEAMEFVALAIYDGVFMTSRDIPEKQLEERGFSQSNLKKYLTTLVQIRQALINDQLKGQQRTEARNLYVPAGVAQMLVSIGEVEVGSYFICPEELSQKELTNIDWSFMRKFSHTLLSMRNLLVSVKEILIPKREGDIDVMSIIVAQASEDSCVLGVHANANDGIAPIKQALALMAGIKLANDYCEILYPNEYHISDYRSPIYEIFSKKTDQ